MPTLEPAPIHLRRIAARVTALSTCACLVAASLVPSLASAAQAEDPAAPEAEAMFRRGQAKYETADYNGAIELWTEAYALVDPSPENASIKALLMYNLAQAHIRAYELDQNAIHLKQAQQLLESFRSNLKVLYDNPTQLKEESAKADMRLAEVEAMLAELEAKDEAKDEEPPAVEPPPVVEPRDDPPLVDDGERSGKPLIIAGGAVTGLGAALGVVGIVGGVMATGANDISDLEPTDLDARDQRFATGRTGNALALVGAIGAGVLLTTGIALIVSGVKRNKQHRRGAAALRHLGPGLSLRF
ncbi:hypothetical protein ENSA5_38280 [Enhygromyxa salina]|uniref:Tetratricopeptide repeat protein n=1 Tax=Enhygromyxa salina TaxID=215803 RepID=A0A2S9XRQ8_9BACT|nr:hypothetical protein [Enhygromyxa salina]PRP95545.1 hypothetical protein ENSA5_38280 [Enhygromyxa salina]